MSRYYFDNFANKSVGPLWAEPEKGEFIEGVPFHGKASFRYGEGSVYEGDIFYDGTNFNKIGFGQQRFNESVLKGPDCTNEKIELYVGQFDYRVTEWIYGNGVLYFVDKQGKPSHWTKGFFEGLNRTGEYVGEFDYSTLLPGYTKENEFIWNNWMKVVFESEKVDYKDIVRLDNLFIGSSYMEFWHYSMYAGEGKIFKNRFDTKYSLNLGIGGSKFSDWLEFIPQLKDLSEPKHIFIALGFNDFNTEQTFDEIYGNFTKCFNMLRQMFPKTKIHWFEIPHNPITKTKFLTKCNKFNSLLKEDSKKLTNFDVVPVNDYLDDDKLNHFHEDLCHLNEAGYDVYYNFVNKITNGVK